MSSRNEFSFCVVVASGRTPAHLPTSSLWTQQLLAPTHRPVRPLQVSSLAFEVFPVLCVQLLNRYHPDTLSVTCMWFIEAVNVPLETGAQEEGTRVPPPETFPETAKGIVRFSGRTR